MSQLYYCLPDHALCPSFTYGASKGHVWPPSCGKSDALPTGAHDKEVVREPLPNQWEGPGRQLDSKGPRIDPW